MKIVYKPCGRCTVIVRFPALTVSRITGRGMPGTPAGVGMIAPGQATDRLQVRIAGRMSRSPRGHSAGSHRDKWTDSRRISLEQSSCESIDLINRDFHFLSPLHLIIFDY